MADVLQFQPNRKVLYARCVFALIFALFPAVAVSVVLFLNNVRAGTIVATALAIYAFIAGLRILFLMVHFDTIRYELGPLTVTNAEGRYWKMRRSTPLEKVTNVDVRQGPLDRFLGVGDIWVFTPSTGALTPEAMLVGIDQPYEIRARILELAEKVRLGPGTDALGIRDGGSKLPDERVLEEMLNTLQRIEVLLQQNRKA